MHKSEVHRSYQRNSFLSGSSFLSARILRVMIMLLCGVIMMVGTPHNVFASGAGKALNAPPTPGPQNCTYTIGYWKTHASSWPVASLVLGGISRSKAELLVILDTEPNGDATYIMGHQLIGSMLNLAQGANPTALGTTVPNANLWLQSNPLGSNPSGPDRAVGINYGIILDDFNNGRIGPGHCGSVPNTPVNTPTNTPVVPTPTNTPAQPTSTPTSICPANLLLNPSFETQTSRVPANWSGGAHTDGTSWIVKPDGVLYGYNGSADAQPMYQDVTATVGWAYSFRFYSSSHVPGTQKIQIQYFTSTGTAIGSPVVHTISRDVDIDGTFGGPYTLTLGAAPSNAAKLRVTVNANGVDWAKIDAACLTGAPSGSTPTNTPVPPTATATKTLVPPTATATKTPIGPTNTPTKTPVPPTATATKTLVPATPTATATNSAVCVGNLLLNPSFETQTSGIPANWSGSARSTTTSWITNPHGTKYGYTSGTGVMYQYVATTPGSTYVFTFYSSSHLPGSQKVQLQYFTSSDVAIGSPVVHTISHDVDTAGTFGGPYTLTLGAAPSNAAKVRVSAHANNVDWAKVDALCLTGTPGGTATSVPSTPTATATSTPSVPEVEFCTYNLNLTVGQRFNIRDYLHYKNSSAPVDWSQIYFTYTAAGANSPTNPANWHLLDFNNGVPVTVVSADTAAGTGNSGDGQYRIYVVRNGMSTYDDHMEIRVSSTPSTDVIDAMCNPPTPTPTAIPTNTSTPSAWSCPANLISNPSFESFASGSVPGWLGKGLSVASSASPNGARYAINSSTDTQPLYQDVVVQVGKPYTVTFYSASHVPGVQTVKLQYYTSAGAAIGSPVTHNISKDIDTGSFGGPYTLTSGAAPSNAATLRVSISANGVDWAKVDAFCMPGTAVTPTATSTNTPVPPTNTPSGPTATKTPVPPTATPTNTGVAPTATNTAVPPTPTNTPTNTATPVWPDTIGGYAWNDANNNGAQDGGETAFANVIVRLWQDSNGDHVAETLLMTRTTGTDGLYEFNSLDTTKSYRVNVELPANHVFSPKDALGVSDELDSDIVPLTGYSDEIALSSGERKMNVDAGIVPVPNNSIVGYAWHDLNFDGAQDVGETGFASTTVKLWLDTNSDRKPDTLLATDGTDSEGYYQFNGLGTNQLYFVQVELPVDHLFSPKDAAGVSDDRDSDISPLTGYSDEITLNAGGRKMNVDAGLISIPANSIGGHAWLDSDNDGAQEQSESGLANVPVHLWQDSNGDHTPDTLIETVMTTVSGFYLFETIDTSKTYFVEVEAPANHVFSPKDAAGVSDELDSDIVPLTGFSDEITLVAGERKLNVDAGIVLVPVNSIVGYAWLDADNDGAQEQGEAAFANVVVSLWQDSNNDHAPDTMVATRTTSAEGYYQFSGLSISKPYLVQVALPANHTFSPKDAAGVSDEQDSDIRPVSGYSDEIQLSAGSRKLNVDAGIVPVPADSIGGYAWLDADNDGAQDVVEVGFASVPVRLWQDTNGDHTPDTMLMTKTTTAAGFYQFNTLDTSKSYFVEVVVPANHLFSPKDAAGVSDELDSDISPLTGYSDEITLAAGQRKMNVDAGIVPVAANTIAGYAWLDVNNNGAQDVGETGFNNVSVKLWKDSNGDHTPDTLVGTRSTNNEGFYQFNALDTTKQYFVQVELPENHTFSPKDAPGVSDDQDSDIVPLTGYSDEIALVAGGVKMNVDAGIVPVPADSIGGYAWLDADQDGAQDLNETGFANVTVRLWEDSNGDHVKDTVVATKTTSAAGSYQFNTLNTSKPYFVEVVVPVNHMFSPKDVAGVSDELDSDVYQATGYSDEIVINAGERKMNVDAGIIFIPVNSIGGYVWLDVNLDGLQGVTETGFANLVVNLWKDSNNDNTPDMVVTTRTASAEGFYLFGSLEISKSYFVEVVAPFNHQFSPKDVGGNDDLDSDINPGTGHSDMITLMSGDRKMNVDAGLAPNPPGRVGGNVWHDLDNDGIEDVGESAYTSVTVRLWQDSNNDNQPDTMVLTDTTDAGGFYEFQPTDGTKPFFVQVEEQVNHLFSPKDVGTDDDVDSDIRPLTGFSDKILLVGGLSKMNVDAGLMLVPANTIAGYAWLDADNDGAQDMGETGFPTITVKLWQDANGDHAADTLMQTVATSADGLYMFSALDTSKSYFVEVALPVHHQFSVKDAVNDAIDSDIYPVSGYSDEVTLTAGERKTNVDAGIVLLVPDCYLGNKVWYDVNGNGLQDSGEIGMPGISIKLYDNLSCTGDEIRSATSDSNGEFLFEELYIGDYCMAYDGIPFTWRLSEPDVNNNGNEEFDSDAYPSSNPEKAELKIRSQNMICQDLQKDMGIYALGSIEEQVWCERSTPVNQNYQPTPFGTDTPLANVGVSLYNDTDCNGSADGAAIASAQTDQAGLYYFGELTTAHVSSTVRSCYVVTVDGNDPDLGTCNEPPASLSHAIELSTNNQYVFDGFSFYPRSAFAAVVDEADLSYKVFLPAVQR